MNTATIEIRTKYSHENWHKVLHMRVLACVFAKAIVSWPFSHTFVFLLFYLEREKKKVLEYASIRFHSLYLTFCCVSLFWLVRCCCRCSLFVSFHFDSFFIFIAYLHIDVYSTLLMALVMLAMVKSSTFGSILSLFTYERVFFLQVIIYYEWEQNES